MKLSFAFIGSFLMVLALSCVVTSCSEKKDKATDKVELERDSAIKHLAQESEKAKRLEQELELARIKAEEDRLEAEFLKSQRIRESELAEQKRAEEAESRLKLEIARRQRIQKDACSNYVNTAYDTLTLLDGTILESAKVTAVTPIMVKFMHKNGIKRVKYSNLPKGIREACKYDEELEKIEVERLAEEKRELLAKQASVRANKAERSKLDHLKPSVSNTQKLSTTSMHVPEKKKIVKPKGRLSVKVVGSGKDGKTIQVTAFTNVDAVVHLDYHWNGYWHRRENVKAKQKLTHTWRGVRSNYSVRLEHNGIVLDRESSKRKSGLGIKDGF